MKVWNRNHQQMPNGVDLWFTCHKWESNEFVSYLITENGILDASPIVSEIGTVHEGHVSNSRGYMKVSPKGNKLALAMESINRFELYEFNNLTGKVSNPLIFPDNYLTAYCIEFSPDCNYIYGSERWGDKLYQFDVSSGNLKRFVNIFQDINPIVNLSQDLFINSKLF